MTRVIRLPNGRDVSLAAYVCAWRALRVTDPEQRFAGFYHFAEPASDILRAFRFGMHDRINRHIAGYAQGRKWSSDWQRQTSNTAREVNTPRLSVHWIPMEFRARLAHRIATD